MPARNSATELECCVLGFIAQNQPCTAYVVRKQLGSSLSSYWSSSAGSIYPLLDRLERRGLLLVRKDGFGTRTRRRYRLSAAGQRQLERWLSPPLSPRAVNHTYDPVRTPVFFLDLVESSQRQEYLERAGRETEIILEQHREDLAAVHGTASPWEVLGREGAIGELEARLEWIRKGLELR